MLRFLALGDSYTVGEGVASSECWPARLVALLRVEGCDIGQHRVIATTGWTTDELAAGIQAASPTGPFDLVSLLIGVNDQYRGRSVDEYRIEFRALLESAIGFAGTRPSRVIVLSIPDWGVTPFAEGRDRQRVAIEIDAFNAANRDEAFLVGAHYVSVTGDSRANPADVVGDGLHPSPAAYERWARLALPAARLALNLR